jgi:hypothetical protein
VSDESEVVSGEVEPSPELAPAVDEKLPDVQLAVRDPSDQHEVMLRMDDHDVQMLLREVQGAALRKWVYELKGNRGIGLTIHAVQDITQRMNWTGKARIGLLLDARGVPVVETEQVEADEGHGPEPFWQATAYAKDEVTGMVLPGASMEPQNMRLRGGGTKFDRFARWKAIQKATRNALGGFIPEEIEQTVIAMFAKDPSRVERIRTEAEQKMAEMPPPLDDDEARALIAEAEAIYDRISELGGGQGKIKLTSGTFGAYKLNAQHSHDRLRDMIAWLRQREEQIPVELAREAEEREAIDTAVEVACPKCGAAATKFCKGIRGSHGERVQARLGEIRATTAKGE